MGGSRHAYQDAPRLKGLLPTRCGPADAVQAGAVSATASSLVMLLQRVVGGGDVSSLELERAVPDPFVLKGSERAAWEELSHWADDEDLRAKDPAYGKFKREWMRDRLHSLER